MNIRYITSEISGFFFFFSVLHGELLVIMQKTWLNIDRFSWPIWGIPACV